jgi:hypothetical protein
MHAMHPYAFLFMNFEMCITSIQNIGLAKVYNTRLYKRIENKERAHFKAHYHKELDDVKNNMALMTSLLKQLV